MIFNQQFRIVLFLGISILWSVAQQNPLQQQNPNTGSLQQSPYTMQQSPYTFDMSTQDFTSLLKENKLNQGIDPQSYLVDSGDQFAIKIDYRGPGVKIFQAIVTPDGFVFLPQGQSILVKDISLSVAKEKIKKELSRKFPDAEIEVFLAQLHYINVRFLSPLTNGFENEFTSNTRLAFAVDFFVQRLLGLKKHTSVHPTPRPQTTPNSEFYFLPKNLDDLNLIPRPQPSLRRIQLIRDGKKQVIDLLKFEQTAQNDINPYLMQEDMIVVPAYYSTHGSVTIQGAVAKEFNFEYLSGDRLIDAVQYAGGLVSGANKSRILVYHYGLSTDSVRVSRLSLPADTAYLLQPEDHILAQFKQQAFDKGQVQIIGEVRFPGSFPIADNDIHLSQLIQQAGGLTAKASLKDARIFRTKFFKGEPNLGIYSGSQLDLLDINILSYLGVRSREEIRLVATDLEKLYKEKDQTQDVLLRDGDLLYIPKPLGIVYLSGAVARPGTYPFHKDWNYADYIEAAGGFTNLAHEGSTRIIRGGTGVWMENEDDLPIFAGDMVFVPETPEQRWQTIMKDIAITLGQLATVAFIIKGL